jgi:hypothetical protein
MKDKWNVKNKKGCLKIHIAINIKTKEILSMKVTDDEYVHDNIAVNVKSKKNSFNESNRC